MPPLFSAPEVRRVYRFVDRSGQPHPILDDHFESLDGAWEAAQAWLGDRGLSAPAMASALAEEFGVEVPDEEAEKLQTVGDVVKYIEANSGK